MTTTTESETAPARQSSRRPAGERTLSRRRSSAPEARTQALIADLGEGSTRRMVEGQGL
jgi:hypothetical protein